ncbi:MAG: hypothetical protein M2R45_02410 [Verrucomicrobia subdivision 3 bacterium]|nr:hypothetical protein [Limisphaerales bacterium]MCS1416384.1 hypothetical protein [Limisphaerales bacterium]
MKFIVILAAVAAAIFLSGCATGPPFHVAVNGLAPQTVSSTASSCVILPGNQDVTPDNLQFREYAAYVERALIRRGFHPASRLEEPDLAIFLSYGIGDPKEHFYSYSLPIFGQTGVSSSTTYGTISSYSDGFASYSGTTYYTPTYGITGYSNHVGTRVTYTRHILIDAVNYTASTSQDKLVPVWKCAITSTGSSDDLRRVFPIMLGAAAQYLGVDTGQTIAVKLYKDDPRVLRIKGIPAEEKQ